MLMAGKKRIVGFKDLGVCQNNYRAMVVVMKKIVPKLPEAKNRI